MILNKSSQFNHTEATNLPISAMSAFNMLPVATFSAVHCSCPKPL